MNKNKRKKSKKRTELYFFFKTLSEDLKDPKVRSWAQIIISVVIGVAFLAYIITSAIHNNEVATTERPSVGNVYEEMERRKQQVSSGDVARPELSLKTDDGAAGGNYVNPVSVSPTTEPTGVYQSPYEESDLSASQSGQTNVSSENVAEGTVQSSDTWISSDEIEELEPGFTMTILDVGQASAALICCDGHYMLFDGGDRDTSSFLFSYLKNTVKVPRFDYIVASHYDADHIAGLIGVIKNGAPADIILGPPYIADTATYNSFMDACNSHGGIVYPRAGDVFYLGSAYCTVVSPVDVTTEWEDENTYSLGIRFEYGNTSFIIMGDATVQTERDSINAGLIRKTDVMVVNHHGSASSTSQEYVSMVSPSVVVISCGAGNEFGHPTDVVLNRLIGVPVYRTDLQGTITLVSDGMNIDIYTER